MLKLPLPGAIGVGLISPSSPWKQQLSRFQLAWNPVAAKVWSKKSALKREIVHREDELVMNVLLSSFMVISSPPRWTSFDQCMPIAGVSASSSVTVFGPGAPAGIAIAGAESKNAPMATEVCILKRVVLKTSQGNLETERRRSEQTKITNEC